MNKYVWWVWDLAPFDFESNTSAIWQRAAHTKYHLLDAEQEPYQEA